MEKPELDINGVLKLPFGEVLSAWARSNAETPAPAPADPTEIESEMAAPSPEVRKQKHTVIGEAICAYLANYKKNKVSIRRIRLDLKLTELPPKGKVWMRVLKYLERHATDWVRKERSLMRKNPLPVSDVAEVPEEPVEKTGSKTSVSAAGSKLPSGFHPLALHAGEKTIGIKMDRETAVLLATQILTVAHDKSGEFNGAFKITGHLAEGRVTVIREK